MAQNDFFLNDPFFKNSVGRDAERIFTIYNQRLIIKIQKVKTIKV